MPLCKLRLPNLSYFRISQYGFSTIPSGISKRNTRYGIVNPFHCEPAPSTQPVLFKSIQNCPSEGIIAISIPALTASLTCIFLAACNMVAKIQIINIIPIGHNHSIPVQVLLQPIRSITLYWHETPPRYYWRN